jgi:hypothetical protein
MHSTTALCLLCISRSHLQFKILARRDGLGALLLVYSSKQLLQKLFGKHWHFRVLVVDGVVVGRV